MRRHTTSSLRVFVLAASIAASPAAAAPPARLLSVDAAATTPLGLAWAAQDRAPGALVRIAGLRDAEGRPLDLALERGRLFAPDFKLYLNGRETPTDAPTRLVYLHGTAEGWPGSSVAISIDASTGAWSGMLVRSDGVFDLTLPAAAGTDTVAAVASVQPADTSGVTRGAISDVLERPFGGLEKGALTAAAKPKRVVPAPGGIFGATIAVETDHEFLGTGTVEDGERFVHNVIAGVSELYERQLGVPLAIQSLFLYPDADDPWNAPEGHTASGAEVLCEFSSYWQSQRPLAAFPRNAAVFFTGKSSSELGGQAWRGGLCNFIARPSSCPFGGYGIVVRQRLNAPNVLITAHELGHTFGSAHTHCYQPEIDQCYAQEARCYSGPESEPEDGGSVMSYCNAWRLSLGEPGKYGNQSERVIGVMRGLVDRVAPACMGRVNDPYELAGIAGPASATLTWVDPFGNETAWSVEQLVKGKWKQVKSLPRNSTTVTIGKLKPGEASFRVRAKIKRDVSDYSNVVVVAVE
jgi:hypothetical protein